MWKVLLVEDEELVRGFLRANVPWQDGGFEVIGEAEDGQDALALIRETNPDVVIADIIMPIMDGLELLKQSKAEGHDALFLMLTGVNDFEHAREALEYGAWNYLLKLSLTPDKLTEILRKAERVLAKRSRDKWENQRFYYQQAYEQVWQQIVNGESEAPLELPWIRRHLYIAIEITGHELGNFHIRKNTESEDCIVHSLRQPGLTHSLIWTDDPKWSPRPTDGQTGPIAAGCCMQWSGLHSSWKTIYEELHRHWYNGGVLPYESASGQTFSLRQFDRTPALPSSSEHTLINLYEEQMLSSFNETLRQEWDNMARRREPLHKVRESALHLYRGCTSMTSVDEQELLQADNHWSLLRRLKELLERQFMFDQERSGLRTDHPQINQIIQYLRENYDLPVTLESAAKLVSMDKYYISGLFKKKTGDSFVHYLQKLRVDKAKKLLRETNVSLNEIAARVGFMEDNYLTKMFKRWTGLTPSEYRKSQS